MAGGGRSIALYRRVTQDWQAILLGNVIRQRGQAGQRDWALVVLLHCAGGGPSDGTGAVEDHADRATDWAVQDDQVFGLVADGDAAALGQLDLDLAAIAGAGVVAVGKGKNPLPF